jgi:hypothetical protein
MDPISVSFQTGLPPDQSLERKFQVNMTWKKMTKTNRADDTIHKREDSLPIDFVGRNLHSEDSHTWQAHYPTDCEVRSMFSLGTFAPPDVSVKMASKARGTTAVGREQGTENMLVSKLPLLRPQYNYQEVSK